MEQSSLNKISEDMAFLKKAVIAIQEHIEDTHLTAEEEILLEESIKNRLAGKTKSLEDVEKALSLNV